MSIAPVQHEIDRFLSTKEPEVICFSGHWGVGKTFAWNRFLEQARKKQQIALGNYSYVSLFGVNSLDEFKYSIFENSVPSSAAGLEPSFETLKSNTSAIARQFGKKYLGLLGQLPKIKSYIGGLGPVWFLSVKETIVCVDDIERHGKDLPVRDVLGLVSSLKEQKRCKVVLILNDEALEQERDKGDFKTYLEKVVDTFLKFEPSAQECANIALTTGTETDTLLAECCVTLGISNIRVIRKIERAVRRVEPILRNFDSQVLRQAVQSLALFGWSVYEPIRAPSIEYLNSRVSRVFTDKEKESAPENEVAWDALLDVYDFMSFDEFDLVLLSGIEKGVFDPIMIDQKGSSLDTKVKAEKASGSFQKAWGVFHQSFADNQEEVLNTIYQAALANIQYMTAVDLNGTVWLMKGLGRPERATELINLYIATRGDDRPSFDLANHPFKDHIRDGDIIAAFKDRYMQFKDKRSPDSILLSIAKTHGWNEVDVGTLSALSSDDLYNVFKNLEGPDLRKIVDTCLEFGGFAGSSPYAEISKRAKEALQRLADESTLNALRVGTYRGM
jgi:hypothetical protein